MSKQKPDIERWSETQVFIALQKRYSEPEWILLRNVRNAVGYARKEERYADAIALNLWPSRGLEVVGFEIKSYRNDWLKELSKPDKSAPIQKFCDKWYIAVGQEDIIQPGELPPTWGLMVPTRKESLKVKVEAPALQPVPIDKLFCLSLVRSAVKESNPPEVLQKQLNDAKKAGIETGREGAKSDLSALNNRLSDLSKSVREFEEASGVKINSWDSGRIGEAVKLVTKTNVLSVVQYQRDAIKRLLKDLDEAVDELDKM
jgi:hypothetical protein